MWFYFLYFILFIIIIIVVISIIIIIIITYTIIFLYSYLSSPVILVITGENVALRPTFSASSRL